jgi:hypothetical protein
LPSTINGKANPDEALRSSLRFPLLMAKKLSRRHAEVEMRDYHRAVAEEVARNLVQGGWSLAPALVKEPPLPPPSSSRFMGEND